MTETIKLTRISGQSFYIDEQGHKWQLVDPETFNALLERLDAVRKAVDDGLPAVRNALGIGEIPFTE